MAKSKHRIVLFTGKDIGFELVRMIHARSDVSLFVVTTRTLRDDLKGYRSAVDACRECGVPMVEAAGVNESAKAQILAFLPDLILSAYYPHRIPVSVINAAPLGAVNL